MIHTDVNIEGLDKAEVLRALYNAKPPMGAGMLAFVPGTLSREEAEQQLVAHTYVDSEGQSHTYFDYLKGRPMKVALERDTINARLYDRDGGEGMCDFVIAVLRVTGDPESPLLLKLHEFGMQAAIAYTEQMLGAESVPTEEIENPDGTKTLVTNIDGAWRGNEQLKEAVEKAKRTLRQ